jgi:hypothetical protein
MSIDAERGLLSIRRYRLYRPLTVHLFLSSFLHIGVRSRRFEKLTHPRQELYRMGILYDEESIAHDSESNTIVCDVPVGQSIPMFSVRLGKPRRSRRRSTWRSLPLYLSFSDLSNDADIARLLSPSVLHTPTIQHRDLTIQTHNMDNDTSIPQSLPPTPAFSGFIHSLHLVDNTPISNSILHQHPGDWTFITAPHNTPGTSTPLSEPETWILIDDS